jgi:hypothetical protein
LVVFSPFLEIFNSFSWRAALKYIIPIIINTPTQSMDGSGVIVGGCTYGGGTIVCPGGITGGITGMITALYAGGSHVSAFGAHHWIAGFRTESVQIILSVPYPGK